MSNDIQVQLRHIVPALWMRVPSITLGDAPSPNALPDAFVTVTIDREATLRMDIYTRPGERQAFTDVIRWSGFVVIGFGERVYLVDLKTNWSSIIPLGAFFSRFHPTSQYLLVASGAGLTCIETTGELRWTSAKIANNGISVDQLREGAVRGEGLWTKPSRWTPFLIDMATGKPVE